MRRVIVMLMAAGFMAIAAVACGGNDGGAGPSTSGPSTGLGVGPGISVSEALASDLSGPLLVNGYLVIQGGEHDDPEEIKLCEALAESFPPQCGGASAVVEGFDIKSVEGVVSEGPVSWTETPVQILGEIDGDVLRVSALSQ